MILELEEEIATMNITRRQLFTSTAASFALAAAARRASAQAPAPVPSLAIQERSTVSLVKGEDRRKNAYNAMMAIDRQVAPQLKHKKYVILKPNNVSTVNQLAATHADTMRGMLDYLSERFKGPVIIAESSAGPTMEGFENFLYTRLPSEYKRVSLLDLNNEGKYQIQPVLDENLHPIPVRLAARLLDPEAFVCCHAILKTHNVTVATLSIKNMTLGAPLHQGPKDTAHWNDKRKYHTGVRQTHYNMMLTAQKMRPFFGATLIDGYEGMEGNGPSSGTPVASRLAIASTDYIAADRVGVETMGIDAKWLGYLMFCWQSGLGQYDLSKIDIEGETIASVKKTYKLHNDLERELRWMGPMTEIPAKLG